MSATTLAYLGPPGTFTEEAARRHDADAELQPFASIQGVALAVASGIAREGVVPIENSLQGSVNDTLDILIQQRTLFIRRELALPIEHCLLVSPNTNVSDISVIYSHPQALGQCRDFLERLFPKAQRVASLSTAAAVDDMQASDRPAAAIAPIGAAKQRGAVALARGIQDSDLNLTRFVILADGDSPPTGADKTSLCFSFAEDKPGLLYNALGEFVKRDLNLAKVESRPAKNFLGEYIFLLDIDGHKEDPAVRDAIAALRANCSLFRVFGSYPRWDGASGANQPAA